jgi:hypothetical protein
LYARNVTFGIKANTQSDFTPTFESRILPLLEEYKGFKEEIPLCGSGSAEAVSINPWGEHKGNADDYHTHTYQEALKTLAEVIDGTLRASNV